MLRPDWTPVEDFLPAPYQQVLVWGRCHLSVHDGGAWRVHLAYLNDYQPHQFCVCGTPLHEVTHWMPVPPGPGDA